MGGKTGYDVEMQDLQPGEEAESVAAPFVLMGLMPMAMPKAGAGCSPSREN